MRIVVAGVVVALLGACNGAAVETTVDRCRRVLSEERAREIGLERERAFTRELADSGFGFLPEDEDRALYVRRKVAWNARDGRPNDSTAYEAPPPPRPSDVDWYHEHCWEGKPRP